jgi:RHS repeat-associated protein
VLIDLNVDWSEATTYFNEPGIDSHLRQTNSATGVSYFLGDHLGSTATLADVNGNVVEQITNDSFGTSGGSARTRYAYSGRERDPDTGLLYYRARFYDPLVARFISEDPIGFVGGINLYAYVSNNPIALRDPLGFCPCTCTLEVRASRINYTLVGFHVYITTTDSCTGKTNAYRAGPDNHGKIEAIAGPYNKEFPDFDGHENDRIVVSLKIPGMREVG